MSKSDIIRKRINDTKRIPINELMLLVKMEIEKEPNMHFVDNWQRGFNTVFEDRKQSLRVKYNMV